MLPKQKISDLYKRFSTDIFRYLYKLTGNRDASEDLLQEVFEKFIAYTAKKDINEDKIRSFLYTTAHNLSINYLIKQNRTAPSAIDELDDPLKTEDRHHDGIVLTDLNNKIYSILETVKPESRSIFIMYKENEMNYDAIAENLSISARTVRRRLKEVIDLLYQELKKEGYLE